MRASESSTASQSTRENASATSVVLMISFAVLLASSTWFSGTAVTPTLVTEWGIQTKQATWLTSSVQLGFVVGTFVYAALNLPDVFNARLVFCASTIIGALLNVGFALSNDVVSASVLRFFNGIVLAGVYPVGMKIVTSHARQGLGWFLSLMVGALTLGTGAPFLIRFLATEYSWQQVTLIASAAALLGGLLMVFAVRDGPHLKERPPFDLKVMVQVFKEKKFLLQSLGYFGHMWELYAFLVP